MEGLFAVSLESEVGANLKLSNSYHINLYLERMNCSTLWVMTQDIFTARSSYVSAVLGIAILSVGLSVRQMRAL